MVGFTHHPDGVIIVNGAIYPLDFWATQEPGYVLPAGYRGREYRPGIRHVLMGAEGDDPQPLRWEEGDAYLAKAKTYAAAFKSWQAAKVAPPDPEVEALRQQIITLAQSAAGIRVDALTAAQVRALCAVLLFRNGALKSDLTVRPLSEWT